MSEMIDRLSAFSRAAGQDAAASFSTPEAIEVMATQVRTGRRRRRVRQSMLAASILAVAGIGYVAVPAILEASDPLLPPAPVGPAGRTVVSTEGALTAFDDGTLSIVLSNGQIMDLVPSDLDEGTAFTAPLKDELCALTEDTMGDLGWTYAGDGQTYKNLVNFGYHGAFSDGVLVDQLESGEQPYDATLLYGEPKAGHWEVAVAFQASPAVAEHLVVRNTTVAFANGAPYAYATTLNPTPSFEVQGDEISRAAWVETAQGKPASYQLCGGTHSGAVPPEDGVYTDYFVSDVWMSDSSGNAIQLGTFVSMITMRDEAKYGGTE